MKSHFQYTLALSAALSLSAPFTIANEHFRPLTEKSYHHLLNPQLLISAKQQTIAKVRGKCELAYLNVKRILADFPALRTLSREQLENWVLDQYCYLSTEQTKLNGIRQTPLELDLAQTKKSVRQSGWGRADTMPGYLDGAFVGWIDVKGSGLASDNQGIETQLKEFKDAQNKIRHHRESALDDLRTSAHSDGLLTLGEGIAEVTRQTAAQMSFDLLNFENRAQLENENSNKLPFETVETYFVIALPIDILKDKGQQVRAALYGRQAHFGRHESNYSIPDDVYRSYQSTNQSTSGHTAVDFGAIWITHPLLKDRFGPSVPGQKFDTQLNSLPWGRGHEAARRFSAGDRFAVYSHLNEMLGEEFIRLWQTAGKTSDESLSSWVRLAESFRTAVIANDRIAAVEKLEQLLARHPQYLNIEFRTILIDTILKPYAKGLANTELQYLNSWDADSKTCLSLLTLPASKAKP